MMLGFPKALKYKKRVLRATSKLKEIKYLQVVKQEAPGLQACHIIMIIKLPLLCRVLIVNVYIPNLPRRPRQC